MTAKILKTITLIALPFTILAATASAGIVYTQGFEGTGYNFYNDPGSAAGTTASVAHSGDQSAQFTLDDTHFAYTRWKSEDLSSYGWKLGDVTASAWEMRTYGQSTLAPYFLFTIKTPDTNQETLAIQFLMPGIGDNVWTLNTVDRDTTTFHVVGDRTGLAAGTFSSSGTQGTLNDLAATEYTPGVLWGSFDIQYVRIGVGLWDTSQTYNGYADDVTIGSASAAPEPGSILLLTSGLIGLAFAARRRKLQ